MKLVHILTILSLSFTLAACGGSDDDDTPTGDDPDVAVVPDDFPSFETFVPEPLEVQSAQSLDIELTSEQIAVGAGVPASNTDFLTVNVSDNTYSVYCESSYLRTTAGTADEAYDMLSVGVPETVFAFEDAIDPIEFTAINSVELDGRIGREFVYRFLFNSEEISGQGRAFYFNDITENITRSAILYFECFGSTGSFDLEINTIQAFLDSPTFESNERNAISTSDPAGRGRKLLSNGTIKVTSK